MLSLPNDPVMLLSFVNTQLRDYYPTLAEFCKAYNISENQLAQRLQCIDYTYDSHTNQFI